MVHIRSSPEALYGLHVGLMYTPTPCCTFYLSSSLGLFCCTEKILGADFHRDFLHRPMLSRKSIYKSTTLLAMNCSSAKVLDCIQVPLWQDAAARQHSCLGKCSCGVLSLLLRRDHETECVKFTLLTMVFDDKDMALLGSSTTLLGAGEEGVPQTEDDSWEGVLAERL